MTKRPADPRAAAAHDARLRAEAEEIVHRVIGLPARRRARELRERLAAERAAIRAQLGAFA